MRLLLRAGRSLFIRKSATAAPKRNMALDRDNYSVKFPSAYFVIPSLLFCGYIFYLTDIVTKNQEEFKINIQSLKDRERDPDLNYLRSHQTGLRR
uniref:Uncharacterized protein LOC100183753 n=1 Tax=Phallusia mammillata TaxID=59560 RepID=A0A6F9DI49_9ASCI|nr:uncharacterized protein LOC100183753 [Phallusia mammillata]